MDTRHARTARGLAGESALVLLVSVIAMAAYAAFVGQDVNWDQRNYHVYVVYAWLSGRTFADVAPAQIQTWLNPLAQLPQYVLIRHLPPHLAGMALGALAGVNGAVLWMLMRRVQDGDPRWQARACAGGVTLMGITGPVLLSETGTTFAEYLCSPLVLGALVAVLPDRSTGSPGPRALATAGALLGAAVGLKLVNLVYVLGLSVALTLMWPAFRLGVLQIVALVVGVVSGAILTGGYWSAHLWLQSGNPIFPFYNALFRSELFDPVNFADTRFVPRSVAGAAITYPVAWLRGLHPTSELPFRDARFALVLLVLPLACAAVAVRHVRRRSGVPGAGGAATIEARRFWLLVLFFTASYMIWLASFGIQRYALPLELLTGVILVLCLERMFGRGRALLAFAGLAAFAILWSRPVDWGRIPYGADWFGVTGAPAGPPTLYVMLGDGEPTAYVIPSLSPRDRFVRLTGNTPIEPDTPLGWRAQTVLDTHAGPIRSLSVAPLDADDRARLERFGLRAAASADCTAFQSRLDRFLTCELSRSPSGSGDR